MAGWAGWKQMHVFVGWSLACISRAVHVMPRVTTVVRVLLACLMDGLIKRNLALLPSDDGIHS